MNTEDMNTEEDIPPREPSVAERLHAGLNDIIIAVNEEGKARMEAEAAGGAPSYEERLQSYARVIGVVTTFSHLLQDEICNVVFDGEGNPLVGDAEEGDDDA